MELIFGGGMTNINESFSSFKPNTQRIERLQKLKQIL